MNSDRWIALLSLVITVGAILFSIWAYRRGEKRRIPTVATASTPEVLVSPIVGRLKGFSMTHNGTPIGDNGVTSLSIYFWNDGQLPILRSDIISPYSVTFPKGVRIVDVAVTKCTRTTLGIEAHFASNEEGEFALIDFAVLEPGDGLNLQIIFDGPPDSPFKFVGSCVGSAKLRVLAPDWRYLVNRSKRIQGIFVPVVIGVFVASILPFAFLFTYLATGTLKPSIPLLVFLGFLIFGGVGALVYGTHRDWSASSVPPEIRNSQAAID